MEIIWVLHIIGVFFDLHIDLKLLLFPFFPRTEHMHKWVHKSQANLHKWLHVQYTQGDTASLRA